MRNTVAWTSWPRGTAAKGRLTRLALALGWPWRRCGIVSIFAVLLFWTPAFGRNDPPLTAFVDESIEIVNPNCFSCIAGDINPGRMYRMKIRWNEYPDATSYVLHSNRAPGTVNVGLAREFYLGSVASCDHVCPPGGAQFWPAVRSFRAQVAGTTFWIEALPSHARGSTLTMGPPTTDKFVVLVPGITPFNCGDAQWSVTQMNDLRNDLAGAGVPADHIIIAGSPASPVPYSPSGSQLSKAAQLSELISTVAPGQRVQVVGYSEGGAVSLLLNALAPGVIDRLALVGSPLSGAPIADLFEALLLSAGLSGPPEASCLTKTQLSQLTLGGSLALNASRPQTPADVATVSGAWTAGPAGVAMPPGIGDGVVGPSSSAVAGVSDNPIALQSNDFAHFHLMQNVLVRSFLIAYLTKPAYPPAGDPPLPTTFPTSFSSGVGTGNVHSGLGWAITVDAGQTRVFTFRVTQTSLLYLRAFAQGAQLTAQLLTPQGGVAATSNGPDYVFPIQNPAIGQWSLRLTNSTGAAAVVAAVPATASPIGLTWSVESPTQAVSRPCRLQAQLTGGTFIPASLSHSAMVYFQPTGASTTTVLLDDGLGADLVAGDGVYSAWLSLMAGPGVYGVLCRTEGDTTSGLHVQRSAIGFLQAVCSADFNGDGFVDFFDHDAFVDAFQSGAIDADFNGDGFVDFFDYADFVSAFELGC